MNYEIKEIDNSEVWNDFVKECDFVNVLSSWEWSEFEKTNGSKVYSYGIFSENTIKGVFSFIIIRSRRGQYIFLRHSIFLDWKNSDVVNLVLSFLKKKSIEHKVNFIRISPTLPETNEYKRIFLKYGFKKSVSRFTDARLTTVLNLENSLDKILAGMRKNTRYLVRKAQKMEIDVESTEGNEFLEYFQKIYQSTVERHKWNAFDFEYIKRQYILFASHGLSRMFVAKYKGNILSVAIFTQFGDQVIYHHSGSVHDQDNVPANYALIAEAINYYKNLGIKEFNFFGVCEKSEKKHPWYGLSLFKRGFGGDERTLLPSYDYPINKRYYFSKLLEFLKHKVFRR
jgi:lipid II:glycine glycyltransferase (peptidoglycan interpeptide bridge formation enzyme)